MFVAMEPRRITYRPVSPNPMFMKWLQEFKDDAVSRGSQSQYAVNEAIKSLRRYPVPLHSGRECAILKGFGKGLCSYLDSKLRQHQEQTNATSINTRTTGTVPESTSAGPVRNPRRRATHRNKTYKPINRSGACALLLALLDHVKSDPERLYLYKDELMHKAQPLCEESFWRPKPGTHYTAWASMTILTRKSLVKSYRRKKAEYSLTDEGLKLASELYNEYKDIPTTNNLMNKDFGGFNNNLMNDDFRHFGNAPLSPSPNERYDDNVASSDDESSAPDINGLNPPRSLQQALSLEDESSECSDKELPLPGTSSSGVQQAAQKKLTSQDSDKAILDADEIIEMPAGCFDVFLLIDKMETSGGLNRKTDLTVIQFDKYNNLKHEYRHLKVGDFTWVARNRVTGQELVLPYIVERKRMDDLASSIKDGRYHEQKFRLKRCGLENVIYLIENFGSNKHVGLPYQALLQAIANTRVQSGFKVHTTDSLAGSVRFLAMMTKRLTIEYEDKTLVGLNKESNEFLMTFDYFNKASAKTKPLTVTETFIRMLLQLKGMSAEKALAITNAYPTPKALIERYKLCEQKEGETLLSSLRHSEAECVGIVANNPRQRYFRSKDYKTRREFISAAGYKQQYHQFRPHPPVPADSGKYS